MTITETTPITRIVDGTEVPAAGAYALDASHSHVGFSVRHLMVSKTKGRFAEVTGTIPSPRTRSSPPSRSRSPWPRSTPATRPATGTSARPTSSTPTTTRPSATAPPRSPRPASDRWTVEGELTVRGVTRPVPLDVTFEGGAKDPWGGSRIGFTARAELDREAFGLTWNQALETGGVLVGKQVQDRHRGRGRPPVGPRRPQTCGLEVGKSTSNSQVVPLAVHKAGSLGCGTVHGAAA